MVFLKGTFDLVHDGVCAIAAEQALITGPLHWDDDPNQSLRLDSDFAVLKPRAECHFVGHATPPGVSPPAACSQASASARWPATSPSSAIAPSTATAP
jgi:hypothetical protein